MGRLLHARRCRRLAAPRAAAAGRGSARRARRARAAEARAAGAPSWRAACACRAARRVSAHTTPTALVARAGLAGLPAAAAAALPRPAARERSCEPRVAQLEYGEHSGRALGQGGVGGAQLLEVASQAEAHLEHVRRGEKLAESTLQRPRVRGAQRGYIEEEDALATRQLQPL